MSSVAKHRDVTVIDYQIIVKSSTLRDSTPAAYNPFQRRSKY